MQADSLHRSLIHGSSVNGAFLIDKPSGLSSAQVVSRIKKCFRLEKAGHAGTLDPMATGLLIVLSGKATRLQSIFLESLKAYRGMIRLGERTTTDDVQGEVIEADDKLAFLHQSDIELMIERIRRAFSGEQVQVPPQVSAVKVDGVRSYARARRGEAVELSSRRVTLEFLDLLFEPPRTLRYAIRVSKGFYVRSLARDIGIFLKSAACLESICRFECGGFELAEAQSLEALLDQGVEASPGGAFVPLDELIARFPKVVLDDEHCAHIRNGEQRTLQRVSQNFPADARFVAVFTEENRFFSLLERGEANKWQFRLN